jgi:RNA polymerase sigma factor (sigma-70 family)
MTATQTTIAEEVASQEADLAGVFRLYHLRVFHYALQLVGNRDDALDITQETFLRLHRHWARRDPAKPISAWLYAIARNLAIDSLRRRGTRAETAEDPAIPDTLARDPEGQATNAELQQRLWSAIRSLPEPLREVLLLRDWHGMRYAEIAEVTGINTTTVTSRLFEARQRLRKQLRGYL